MRESTAVKLKTYWGASTLQRNSLYSVRRLSVTLVNHILGATVFLKPRSKLDFLLLINDPHSLFLNSWSATFLVIQSTDG